MAARGKTTRKRKRSQRGGLNETLQAYKVRLGRAEALAHVGDWDLDLATRTMRGSPVARAIYGIGSKGAVLSLSVIQQCVLPAYREKLDKALDALIRQGEVYDVEFQIARVSDGQIRTIHSRAERILSSSGEPRKIVGVLQDITDLRIAQTALQEREAKLASIFRAAPVGIGLVVNRIIQEANDSLCELTGYRREELIHHSSRMLYLSDEEYESVGRQRYEEMAAHGTATRETQWKRKGGTVLHIILSSTPLDPADFSKGFTFIAVDITQRKLTEQALGEKTEELEQYFTSALDLLCIADTDGHFRRLNREWESTLGYPIGDLEGKSFLDLVHPEDLDATRRSMSQLLNQKSVLNFVNRHRASDGTYRWIEWRSFPAGKLIYACARDITEQRRSYDALRENETRMKAIVDAAPFGAHTYDLLPDGSLVFAGANASADRILGIDHSLLIGKTIEEAFPALSATPIPRQYRQVARSGQNFEDDQIAYSEGAISGAFEIHAFQTGSNRMTVFFRDITERKKAESALKESEASLHSLINTRKEAIWSIDREYRYVTFNTFFRDSYYAAYGTKIEKGDNAIDILTPELRAFWKQRYDTALSGQRIVFDFSEEIEGLLHSFEVSLNPIVSDSGITGVSALSVDTTEQKRAKNTLQMFQFSIDQASDAVFWMRRDGGFTYVNNKACSSLGYTRDELLKLKLWDIDPIYPQEQWFSNWNGYQRNRQGGGERVETLHRRKDGTTFPVDVISQHLWFGDEELHVAVVRDISERKRTEEALRLTRFTIENVADAIYWMNPDASIVDVNAAASRMLGYSREQLLGKTLFEINPDLTPERWHTIWSTLTEKGRLSFETRHRAQDGHIIPVDITANYIAFGDRELDCAFVRDITEQKQAHQALRDSETQLRSIFENSSAGIALVGLDGRYLKVNPALSRIFGYAPQELLNLDFFHLTYPDDLQMSKDLMREILDARGRTIHYTKRYLHKDGHTIWAEVSTLLVSDSGGNPAYFITHTTDITERKRAEEKIEEQARLLDVAHDAIIVRDIGDTLLYMNRAAERLYGWTFAEAHEIPALTFVAESDREKFLSSMKIFLERGEWEGELRQMTKEGKELTVQTRWTLVRDKDGKPAARLVINRDITEQRRLEAQFRRAQRLESLGTLAGGIAHDLNNVLAPITMSLALLDRRTTDPVLKKYVATLEASAQRGSEIVKQVLLFARGAEKDFAPQQLRYVVREISAIIHETFPRNITLHTDVPKELRYVLGEATQLHQVLMNLCVNARDAMPQGGELTIAASEISLNEADVRSHGGTTPGDYVVLSVADTGTGIPVDIQEMIFEPFFTTKDTGKGTGLGLSTVYAIVRNHNGFITLHSEVGKGSNFKVYLPVFPGQEIPQARAKPALPLAGHGEQVMVVDDEQALLEISREILLANGYKVLTATNGAEAVSIFSSLPRGSVDLILTDVNMPGMDGPDAVRTIRKIDPGVKVIIASGLVSEHGSLEREELHIQGYLMKPYTAQRLLTAIRDVLKDK